MRLRTWHKLLAIVGLVIALASCSVSKETVDWQSGELRKMEFVDPQFADIKNDTITYMVSYGSLPCRVPVQVDSKNTFFYKEIKPLISARQLDTRSELKVCHTKLKTPTPPAPVAPPSAPASQR